MRCWQSKITDGPPADFKHALAVASPASGVILPLEDSKNPLIALRCLGEGVVLKLTGQQVFSPVTGKIVEFLPTCQLIKIKASNGMSLQISFVEDISKLMAEKFYIDARKGQAIKQGESLFRFDINLLKTNHIAPLLAVTITNAARAQCVVPIQYQRKVMASIDNLMTLYL